MDNKKDIVRRSQLRRALELIVGNLPEPVDLSSYAKKTEIKAAVVTAMEEHVYQVNPSDGDITDFLDKDAIQNQNPLQWSCIPPGFSKEATDVDYLDASLVFRILKDSVGGYSDFPVTGAFVNPDTGNYVLVLRPFYDQDANLVCGQVEADGSALHFRWWFRERTLTEDEYKSLDVRDPRTTYYIVKS